MAIIEFVLLKPKKELFEEFKEKILPTLVNNLYASGVQNKKGAGIVATENGRELKDEEFTAAYFFQWTSVQHFKSFVVSPEYREFGSQVKKGGYASGPADLRLIDFPEDSSWIFGSNTVAEFLIIKPKDASESSVQNVLQKLQSGLPQFNDSKAVVGSTLNLERQEVAVVSSYASDAVSYLAFETQPLHTIFFIPQNGRRS
ncbi:hypothetical protein F5B22DRAFT_603555 [Xylaria bambusicola]|uniref:uncharacterized protein n=1 Tax=Xylaria bambusicola TaxID=326684 RepID=UPI002007DBFB|nr:uncharacterized protein F5B22DRAFT_603555 [Xylaria bambusicola]KAI0517621.1 hypothetical protein F5B22DRAFT_603555 [Xylaria bambusicola]